jgi:acyl carrier protein
MDVAGSIRSFIRDELMYGDSSVSIEDETPLCDGIIDSIALMDLVGFLEERFGIQIDDQDLVAENFRSVSAIEQLVQRRKEET